MIVKSAGARFMAAFNDIEDHLRATLHADVHVEFTQLARAYSDRKRLNRQQRDALAAYASLRNAISHGRYYGGRPIAEPVDEVVDQIEQLRDLLKNPPTALSVLGAMKVQSVAPGDPVGTALNYVRDFDFSQLPVYDDGTYSGLLTTNAVARWLANQLISNDGYAETASVAEVIKFAEQHECALLVPRTIPVNEALHLLAHGGKGGKPVTALIVTQNGKTNETPLAVVVAEDVAALSAALTFA